MINHKEKITQVIFHVIDEINQQLAENQRIEKSMATTLLGKSAVLDSLGLVNLIVTVEEEIEEQFGVNITLADERAISQERSPFRTIETLMEYIYVLLKEHGDT
jgi:acyl carrier protein